MCSDITSPEGQPRPARTPGRGWAVVLVLGTALATALAARFLADPGLVDLFVAERAAPDWLGAVLLAHIVGGMTALVFGTLNWAAKRPPDGSRVRHRWAGRIYLAGVLASAAAALVMVPFVTRDWGGWIGIGMLAVIWPLVSMAAVSAGRSGRVADHRRLIRHSIALSYAAVTLRLQLLGLELAVPGASQDYYGLVLWTCWVPNLAVSLLIGSRPVNPYASTPPADNPTR